MRVHAVEPTKRFTLPHIVCEVATECSLQVLCDSLCNQSLNLFNHSLQPEKVCVRIINVCVTYLVCGLFVSH